MMKNTHLPGWLSFLWDVVKLVILAFIIVWPIHKFVFQPFLVQGPSMEPSFFDKEYLIVEEISYRFEHPRRGEVIVFKSPGNPEDYLIKRAIGLPSERVTIKGGEVTIYNDSRPGGFKLDEFYLPSGLTTGGDLDIQISSNQYFVLGDNRSVSLDSRSFGLVDRKSIVGRVWFRGWPLSKITKLSTPVYSVRP